MKMLIMVLSLLLSGCANVGTIEMERDCEMAIEDRYAYVESFNSTHILCAKNIGFDDEKMIIPNQWGS